MTVNKGVRVVILNAQTSNLCHNTRETTYKNCSEVQSERSTGYISQVSHLMLVQALRLDRYQFLGCITGHALTDLPAVSNDTFVIVNSSNPDSIKKENGSRACCKLINAGHLADRWLLFGQQHRASSLSHYR